MMDLNQPFPSHSNGSELWTEPTRGVMRPPGIQTSAKLWAPNLLCKSVSPPPQTVPEDWPRLPLPGPPGRVGAEVWNPQGSTPRFRASADQGPTGCWLPCRTRRGWFVILAKWRWRLPSPGLRSALVTQQKLREMCFCPTRAQGCKIDLKLGWKGGMRCQEGQH